MAERRDLTERNLENQRPIPPLDFCQGLPFKVRWMGRDAQTGRDLVQFPDGSIVRAGKRIFSGNCPRGTMVDVVDCGANGFITIDWRDAEIPNPLIIPELEPEPWYVLIDTAFTRFSLDNPYRQADIERTYLKNIKGNDKALGLNYLGLLSDITPRFTASLFALCEEVLSLPLELDVETLREYQQLWILSGNGDGSFGGGNRITDEAVDIIIESGCKLFLLADDEPFFHTANKILIKKYNLQDKPDPPITGNYGDPWVFGDWIHPSKVFMEQDSIFDGVKELPGGSTISTVDVKMLPKFKVIAETDASYPEMTYPDPFPTIAILRDL